MWKKFFQFIEIKTKITSVSPFLMVLAYLFYRRQTVDPKLTAVFFAAMFLFDLTTTAINNYIDSRDYPEMLPFGRSASKAIICAMFLVSTALGLYLAACTDVVVLLVGVLCFLCGVCYTYGPIPISRLPLGEVFSGIFQGTLIPFLLLYINMPKDTYLTLELGVSEIGLTLKVVPLITLVLLSAIPTMATADIMLANNICDVEADVQVSRFTLPYFIGKKRALQLFALLYYLCYLTLCIMVIFALLHPVSLVFLATLPFVQKNIRIFRRKQKKSTTFVSAIKNYVILMGGYIAAILLGGLAVGR